ncbi:hypothetical protein BJF78_06075 [Pseudonocardia sp. CNS-139]|nr:hypothetical protein BJF78_06075 [Pseudonocardia sp. CNS-139]
MTVVPTPPDPLDEQRHAAQAQLERAVGEGRLTLDEFTDRVERVWAADGAAELARTVADLPVPVVGQRPAAARSTLVTVLGDIRRRGRWALRPRTTAVLLVGDLDIDLRGALIGDHDEITIDVYSILGDAEVVVPEGVEVELVGFSLLGDRRVELAAVPRLPGTPVVRIRMFALIGDARIRSAD